MRQRAANRHVHEEQPERGVLQSRARLQIVELAREQERADGHGCRLGDERPEDGTDDQNGAPPRGGRSTPGVGYAAQRRLRESDNRTGRRERHDDDDEQRFRVVDHVVEVMPRRFPAGIADHRDEEHDRPEAEDDFDLAEKVQHPGSHARRLGPSVGAGALVVSALAVVRERGEAGRRERVDDGQQEDRRGDRVERFDVRAFPENLADGLAARIGIGRKGPGELLEHLGRRHHPITLLKDERSNKRDTAAGYSWAWARTNPSSSSSPAARSRSRIQARYSSLSPASQSWISCATTWPSPMARCAGRGAAQCARPLPERNRR